MMIYDQYDSCTTVHVFFACLRPATNLTPQTQLTLRCVQSVAVCCGENRTPAATAARVARGLTFWRSRGQAGTPSMVASAALPNVEVDNFVSQEELANPPSKCQTPLVES